jgi:hypothetical protein
VITPESARNRPFTQVIIMCRAENWATLWVESMDQVLVPAGRRVSVIVGCPQQSIRG